MPSLVALAAAISGASAAFQGFNYGSTFTDRSPKVQSDFEAEFKTAAGLEGTNGGFTSARLYTMIQAGSDSDPISAIPAAIKTKTSLLLGLWASAGQDSFNKEVAALKKTIVQYCGQLDGLVAGISVGSEDLYRISPIGMKNSPDPGASPDTLVSYIKLVRDTIKGSCLEKAPIGHVDTWTAYANATNKPVIDAIDFVGMDAYPYFENQKPNGLENAAKLFQAAIDNTKSATGDLPIFIAETGWPVSGPTENSAVPGIDAAQTYWRQVGCPMFGNVNVWWYTLQDSAPTTPSPSFGVIGSTLTTKPLYDLSCDGYKNQTSANPSKPGQSSAPASTGAQIPATTAPSNATQTTARGAASGSVAPTAPSGTTGVVTVPTNAASRLNMMAGVAAGVVLAAAAL
ncbi:uncharacterized protein UV8b_04913 [Ustilaginoidea virens]|uniref:Probable glucan endo-1,3-beta-glucosidase eglC n=1 Tax=Ustilaginoidea virens TaxID=1159556 RepID=A0A063BUL7_USTVR|nr:uncharacterized protein UV8b_04913 [Ustilaginoidea virens]QUC20672.1 hypothetical protein UV8b_04913 [Ustilaginoidea virens]GAO15273.1 hypothetical protein UVI_02040980 [Ustilaginoidea virens]